jgi:apolipoprotein N-acyltransferase
VRALEFGRPQLRATDTGQSGLIDERGAWVDSLPLNQIGVLEAQIVPRSGTTPYAWWGDRAVLVACLLALLAALAGGRVPSGASEQTRQEVER